MMHILLVEDDLALSSIVDKRLKAAGYQVSTTHSSQAAIALLERESFQLALIDIGLPDQDGFSVANAIRESYQFPFVFLTAMSSAEHRLEGYEIGAADYIPKPFHFKELLLRIENILGSPNGSSPLATKRFSLYPESREIVFKDKKRILISKREFLLLHYLIEVTPRIVSRQEVHEKVWNTGSNSSDRSVDNSILRLRNTLGEEYSTPIRSIRGAGYQWLEEPS